MSWSCCRGVEAERERGEGDGPIYDGTGSAQRELLLDGGDRALVGMRLVGSCLCGTKSVSLGGSPDSARLTESSSPESNTSFIAQSVSGRGAGVDVGGVVLGIVGVGVVLILLVGVLILLRFRHLP